MKPILFTAGPVVIPAFGVVLSFALLMCLFIMWRLYKNNLAFLRFHVTLDSFFDSVLVFLLSFGMGARILHILEHWHYFSTDVLRSLLFLHFPGFSFLGGTIGGIMGLWLYCRGKKLPFLLLVDLLIIGLAFTFSFSRIGSLLGGDSYGKETNFFLNVSIPGLSGMRHPTQLYEAILGFVLFALLYYLYHKGKIASGLLTLYFLLIIGITRFFIEMLRGDSVYLRGIAVAQILSIFFVLVSLSILAVAKREALRSFVTMYILRKKIT